MTRAARDVSRGEGGGLHGCIYARCTPVDDRDPLVYPGAPEYLRCDLSDADVHGGPDGIDNDCDGTVDEDAEPAPELCNGIDDDCDGEIGEGATDGDCAEPSAE